MALFIMTGYAIIIYLNQITLNPEKEITLMLVVFAFSIWVGIGTAAISEWISQK